MDLSDHSDSIHKSVQKLKYLTSQIKRVDGSCLDDLFERQNFAHWLRELCKVGLYVLMVVVVMLVVVPCVLWCVQQMMNKIIKEAFVVQGSNVGKENTENSQDIIQ